eukprot:TRINITY_DN7470_c0_g1_i3.p1 TRINITY_DN7470_c0_g1~~TRINITY_DN7470_c0_g1_i3.p1  ORF type:complete len:646 (+),score=133.74 TRINITY_DN7470_c0_g1_i3:125-2062(+)
MIAVERYRGAPEMMRPLDSLRRDLFAAERPSGAAASERHRNATALRFQNLRAAAGNVDLVLKLVKEAEHACKDAQSLSEVYCAAVANVAGESSDSSRGGIVDLFVKHMRLLCELNPTQAREFHNRQRADGAHLVDARIYEARAVMEYKLGDTAKAVKMLTEGIRVGCKPTELLRESLQKLQTPQGPESRPKLAAASAAAELDALSGILSPVQAAVTSQPSVRSFCTSPQAQETPLEAEEPQKSVRAPVATAADQQMSSASSVSQMRNEDRVWAALRKLAESSDSRCRLSATLSAWRRETELAQQRRRTSLFDALGAQVRAGQQTGQAVEHFRLRSQTSLLAKATFACWRCAVQDRHRRSDHLAACQMREVRHIACRELAEAARLLIWWRCATSEAIRVREAQAPLINEAEPPEAYDLSHQKAGLLDSLLDELHMPSTSGVDDTAKQLTSRKVREVEHAGRAPHAAAASALEKPLQHYAEGECCITSQRSDGVAFDIILASPYPALVSSQRSRDAAGSARQDVEDEEELQCTSQRRPLREFCSNGGADACVKSVKAAGAPSADVVRQHSDIDRCRHAAACAERGHKQGVSVKENRSSAGSRDASQSEVPPARLGGVAAAAQRAGGAGTRAPPAAAGSGRSKAKLVR